MAIYRNPLLQARRLRVGAHLSPAAKRRLMWMLFYKTHGRNARLTCRHFAISSATFYPVVAPL
jgi:hypothetical protein